MTTLHAVLNGWFVLRTSHQPRGLQFLDASESNLLLATRTKWMKEEMDSLLYLISCIANTMELFSTRLLGTLL